MGIYDQGFDFKMAFGDSKKMWQIIAAVVVVLIIGAAGFFLMQAAKPSALEFKFAKNPIKPDETTAVIVKVTNITEADAVDVTLNLRAKEYSEFTVYSSGLGFDGKIPLLSKGTFREITFDVNPVNSIPPGTYVLVANTKINGQDFEKEAVLTVQK